MVNGVQLNTDFSGIKPNEARGVGFPVSDPKMGWLGKIVESFTRENSKKTGMLLVFKVEGMEGPVAGQLAEMTYNLSNPNQQAVDIAQGELSAIAHVTGTLRVGNTLELHGKPFRTLWREQLVDGKPHPQGFTECFGYLDANGNPPGKAGQGPVQAHPVQQGGFGGPANQGGGFGPGQGGNGSGNGGGNWNPNPNLNPTGAAVDPNANQGGNNWNQGGQQQGTGNAAGGWGANGGGNSGAPAWAGNK